LPSQKLFPLLQIHGNTDVVGNDVFLTLLTTAAPRSALFAVDVVLSVIVRPGYTVAAVVVVVISITTVALRLVVVLVLALVHGHPVRGDTPRAVHDDTA
jgi:hypothetical protein